MAELSIRDMGLDERPGSGSESTSGAMGGTEAERPAPRLAPAAPPPPAPGAARAGVNRGAAGAFFGFLFCLVGVGIACTPADSWAQLLNWLGVSSAGAESRWAAASILFICGVSFLNTRPHYFLLSGALFAGCGYVVDLLGGGRGSEWMTARAGSAGAVGALALAALVFAYLVHVRGDARPSLRGLISLCLMWTAAVGLLRGWFDVEALAGRAGPDFSKVLHEWRSECAWAVVLALTAVSVSLSRTRSVHLLNALVLAVLAYHCVKSGMVQVREFPELSTSDRLVSIEHVSYANVAMWRWVAALELGCLSAVLLHMSLGLGAISLAVALIWMFGGLTIHRTLGTMSVMRAMNEEISKGMSEHPLGNWGMPAGESSRPIAAPPAPGGANFGEPSSPLQGNRPLLTYADMKRQQEQSARLDRERIIREVTPLAWMYLTAVCAGIFGASGWCGLISTRRGRVLSSFLLWCAMGAATAALVAVWPRDPTQTWEAWWAAFRLSRYHVYVIWLAFGLAAALTVSLSALRAEALSGGMMGSVAVVFLGTAASIGAVAVLIEFGGFPRLPTWVYIALAVGQSSLAWALLMSEGVRVRRRASIPMPA